MKTLPLIPNPFIALFASGSSVHDISEEDLAHIKANAFVISLNYAPIHLKAHLNMWSDRKVSNFLEQHYNKHPKDCLFLAQEGRVSEHFKKKIDYWFSKKKEGLKGNYTLVWALQLLQKYYPKKTILLFGVDMYAPNFKEAKWYDRYTDFDRKKRGKNYKISIKLKQCAKQIRQYISKNGVYNCNPLSQLDYFEKKDWRKIFHLNILHLCPSALAGAPVHLSHIINKYTLCESKTILKKNFSGKKLNKLNWDYDIINPSSQQLKEAINWADVIHYHRNIYPYWVSNKPALIQFHSPHSNYQTRKTFAQLNNRKLVVAQHQALIYKDALIIPNMIDIWNPIYQVEKKPDKKIKIFYSWASERTGGWGDKGSRPTIAILEKIKAKYGNKVEICILNNVPYEQCMAEKRTAHICIDECVTGSYHLQSLEGCASGALTFNNLNPQILSFIQQVSQQQTHPFVLTNLKQLFDKLCFYIEHPKALEEIGTNARQWMERHWNPQKLVYQYIQAYFNLVSYNDVMPNKYLKKVGNGLSKSPALVLKKATAASIKNTKPFKLPQQKEKYSIQKLYQKYKGKDIYIFGTGPSLFKINPEDFKDKICFGINYSFEIMPYMDYIFAHVIETYEAIRQVVDNKKLILPNTLVRQYYRDRKKNILPNRIPTSNQEAYIYPLQNPSEKNIAKKHTNLTIDTNFFCWSTTTHSAIHIAAYMGAKNIYLVGMDYKLFPNGKVHFESKHSPIFGQQAWNALAKHKQGDEWLKQKLKAKKIRLAPVKKIFFRKKQVNLKAFSAKKSSSVQGKSIQRLYRQYLGQDIYIFGSGPSLLKVNPEDFRDKICFGINYTFEIMPYMDYILVHEIETYESIKDAVDNKKLLLSEWLFRHDFGNKKNAHLPKHIVAQNPEAYVYPLQNPYDKNLKHKKVDLSKNAQIFTFTTTTHSAIHLAAYMGAKNIYLIGVDYALFSNGKVHFDAKNSPVYGQQKWHTFKRHQLGDRWLAKQLKNKGIKVENISHKYHPQAAPHFPSQLLH